MLKKIIGYSILSIILLGAAFSLSIINHSPWYDGFIILGIALIVISLIFLGVYLFYIIL